LAFTAAACVLHAPGPSQGQSRVSKSDCDVFASYVLDEARTFKDKLSKEFLNTTLRFLRSGCAAKDKDGEIQMVTMTTQDAASLRTALRLMGKIDVIGMSGVNGCARPANGVCPPREENAARRTGD
jgi:hypothetical protein